MSSPAVALERALVAGHGDFAVGIVSAAAQITGRGEMFVSLTNRDLCTADVESRMRDIIEQEHIRVIFTDLPAGSCTMAARRLQRERRDLLVVTGANLATLLEWCFLPPDADVDVIRRAVEKGAASLHVLTPPDSGSLPSITREDPRGH